MEHSTLAEPKEAQLALLHSYTCPGVSGTAFALCFLTLNTRLVSALGELSHGANGSESSIQPRFHPVCALCTLNPLRSQARGLFPSHAALLYNHDQSEHLPCLSSSRRTSNMGTQSLIKGHTLNPALRRQVYHKFEASLGYTGVCDHPRLHSKTSYTIK